MIVIKHVTFDEGFSAFMQETSKEFAPIDDRDHAIERGLNHRQEDKYQDQCALKVGESELLITRNQESTVNSASGNAGSSATKVREGNEQSRYPSRKRREWPYV